MWELDHKESWALTSWCFELWCWRRLFRVPWTARFNQSVLKEISPKCSLEGLVAEVETPILWPPDAKNWLIGKDPDAGKDWRQEEKGTTENEMIGWHHWLDGHEFEQALGSLVRCSTWGHKESDMTEQLSRTELICGSANLALTAGSQGTHTQGSVQAARSKVRGLLCFVSEA